MENKCNKTPNNINNNNNTNSKYMDHMYCHTNQNKGYNNVAVGNANGGAGSPNADVLALLKENKQLKAMLILHLDLIQEQSDQLIAKDKLLVTQTEEIERLSARNNSLESQTQELQQQLQRQIKRSGELSTLPPPPLAKIQCKSNAASLAVTNNSTVTLLQTINNSAVNATTGVQQPNIIGECNGKLISKIILQRVSTPAKRLQSLRSPQSQTTDTENDEIEEEDEEDDMEEEEEEEEENPDNDEIMDDENNDDEDNCRNGENLFFEIERDQDTNESKTNTPAIEIEDFEDTGNSTEDSNEVLAVQSKRLRLRQAAKLCLTIPRGAKPSVSMAFTNKRQATYKALTSNAKIQSVSATPPAPSRGKQMPLMRWHAPDFHTDESASCDSATETEKRSISATPVSPSKPVVSVSETKHTYSINLLSSTTHSQVPTRAKVKRSYLSTSQLYCAREWEDEAFAAENNYEFIKAEAKALDADAPMLEIPKWTEHELTPSYCIEGTEDLSDESFLKRHAKLEVDEKRRKKWDVQQIREQRRIERLKRRHCKDEIANNQESPMLQSFYPTSEAVQTICFMHDLPIQAFGEMIPRLGGNIERKDFYLPWLEKNLQLNAPSINKGGHVVATALASTSSTQLTQQQMLNSSFVFLKKRKRQQSSSVSITTTSRQRSLAAKTTSANSTHGCLQPFTATAGITSVHSDTINPISNSSTDATTISTISGTTSITTMSTVNELTN
ncbi:protein male-specific lethal-1 isoform X1 [Glossina fuscipes]|uniref:Protein male-specific lethal-1 isoform X1 n=1 Tax=Glossina fuscipes TaxID=7396 RepID=A0A8U0WJ51_9MUSC|nr:protein male-specific lethal-1 isoform X1 [Glossina fuscipes]